VYTLVVEIIRKSTLPTPEEVIPRLREAAATAHSIKLREPRPSGFPLLFTADLELIEPALAYSVAAWEHMLSAPQLGGRAGAELVAKRRIRSQS